MGWVKGGDVCISRGVAWEDGGCGCVSGWILWLMLGWSCVKVEQLFDVCTDGGVGDGVEVNGA